MPQIPKELLALGVSEVKVDRIRKRLLMGSEGLDKTGKTEFMLTCPDPIGVINLDIGLEGVAERKVKEKKLKLPTGREIWVFTKNVISIGANFVPVGQKEYRDYFKETMGAYHAFVRSPDVRTVAVDTHTDMWELGKLAEFGTIAPAVNVKQAYNSINAIFRSMVREVYDTEKNLILTHKLKPMYKKTKVGDKIVDEWDGETYKKTGFSDDQFLIQVNLVHKYINGQFVLEVRNCRQNASLNGFEFTGTECTFLNLAKWVYEGTLDKDWM